MQPLPRHKISPRISVTYLVPILEEFIAIWKNVLLIDPFELFLHFLELAQYFAL